MTMWAALIILLGLVCTVPGAPVSLCPKSCSCTAKGIYLEARCKSFDFLNKPLSPEQINSIMALDISNGSAVKINSNLRALRHLKRLNLASNKIQHFTATSLPKSLEYLDLSQNFIKHLPQDLHVLPALKELHIFGNPISCNCDSSYVRDALIKKGVIIPKSPKCESPQEFRGKPWSLVACTHHGDAENLFEDMQGDAPYEGSGSGDVSLITESEPSEKSENWDSSIEDEFIVGSPVKAESSTPVELQPSTEAPEPELEGSGDEVEGTTSDFSIVNETQETSTEAPKADADEDEDEDEDENDYEDYDITEAATTVSEPPVVTEDISLLNRGIKACNFDCSTAAPVEDTDAANDTEPAPGLLEGIQIIAKDLDIINDGETTSTTTSTTEAPTTATHAPKESAVDLNRAINTDKKNLSDAEIIKDDLNTDKETGNISEDPAKQQQSHTTFIFLSVLLLIIVCLVVYAIVKKRKMRRNRRGSITGKDPAKEAVPEEIELLKKTVSQTDKPNGTHEAIPLINGHNENQKNADEILPPDANNEMKPVEDGDDVELRPKKPDQQNLLTPETKRVTIKASEIPNSTPKTPILVTRHMNSDGSIVTTPNIDQHV